MPDVSTKKTPKNAAGAKKIGYFAKKRAYHITEATSHLQKFGLNVSEAEGVQYLHDLAVSKKEGLLPTPFMLEFQVKEAIATANLKAFLSKCLQEYQP